MSALGPIIRGDKSILEHDLTHFTSGLPFYPAFDTGWREGDLVIAPERVKITRHSGGAYAGYSFYADGDSGLRYYVTHLRSDRAPLGASVLKGGRLGVVGNFVGARVPHAHVGINAERLLGAGRQLRHNTNYTHGQPTIGEQLPQLAQPLPPEPKEEDEMYDWFLDWFEWRLFDGTPAGRPASAPARIPADALKAAELAARYRKEKPSDAAPFVATLSEIHRLSAPQ